MVYVTNCPNIKMGLAAVEDLLSHLLRCLLAFTYIRQNYGAHNQRSHVTVSVRSSAFIWIVELIETVEAQASCELYGLLKRPDEKYVTEKAYDNPKFVEDLVRDIAGQLNQDKRISGYTVEAENFESIHNHSAYAQIHCEHSD